MPASKTPNKKNSTISKASAHKHDAQKNKKRIKQTDAEILPAESKGKNISVSRQITFINFVSPEMLEEYKRVDPELLDMFKADYVKQRNHSREIENRVASYNFIIRLALIVAVILVSYLVQEIIITLTVTVFAILYLFERMIKGIFNQLFNKSEDD